MSEPKRVPALSCSECGGLLVEDRAGVGPVSSYARAHEPKRTLWEHHRRMPSGFDMGTGLRYECTQCGRIVMLGRWPNPAHRGDRADRRSKK
jgi:hypothetical protein